MAVGRHREPTSLGAIPAGLSLSICHKTNGTDAVLLYEYQIRDHIDGLTEYAANVRAKFDADAKASELLLDARTLEQMHTSLNDMLPRSAKNASKLGGHISWMIEHLSDDNPKSCRCDIDDICNHDIRDIEKAFRKWCQKQDHYDSELVTAISALVLRQEHDSAVRKAFVILKERIAKLFGVPDNLDGPDLVNRVFGQSGCHGLSIDDSERQAIRDLLAGLYGVFRNKYAHTNTSPSWAESDAIISMLNFVLKDLARLKSNATP